jgi:hypothetical protein
MKKIFLFPVLVTAALFLFSCVENKTSETSLKKHYANVTTRVVGVGTSEDIAVMDSYSSYYALLQGVHYRIDGGKVKLKMDYSNAGGVSIETLTESKVTRPWNGFVIYDYPYSGNLTVNSAKIEKTQASIRLTRPFSFLSKMIAKAVLEHYTGDDGNYTGMVYITTMDYRVENNESVLIIADLILAEDSKK